MPWYLQLCCYVIIFLCVAVCLFFGAVLTYGFVRACRRIAADSSAAAGAGAAMRTREARFALDSIAPPPFLPATDEERTTPRTFLPKALRDHTSELPPGTPDYAD